MAFEALKETAYSTGGGVNVFWKPWEERSDAPEELIGECVYAGSSELTFEGVPQRYASLVYRTEDGRLWVVTLTGGQLRWQFAILDHVGNPLSSAVKMRSTGLAEDWDGPSPPRNFVSLHADPMGNIVNPSIEKGHPTGGRRWALSSADHGQRALAKHPEMANLPFPDWYANDLDLSKRSEDDISANEKLMALVGGTAQPGAVTYTEAAPAAPAPLAGDEAARAQLQASYAALPEHLQEKCRTEWAAAGVSPGKATGGDLQTAADVLTLVVDDANKAAAPAASADPFAAPATDQQQRVAEHLAENGDTPKTFAPGEEPF